MTPIRTFLFYMFFIYTEEDLLKIRDYKADKKALYANKRFDSDKITTNDVLTVLKRSNFKCHYCKDNLNKDTWQLDHYRSRFTGGKNSIENLCASCKWCNTMKNALQGDDFLLKCKKIVLANMDTELPHPSEKNKTIPLSHFPLSLSWIGKKARKIKGYLTYNID